MDTSRRDISSLSKEEKLKLYDAIQEKKRRHLLRKDSYQPNEGQLPLHKSRARIRLVASGNGAGKTTAAIHEALWTADGFNPVTKEYTPVPCDVIIVLDKASKADDIWLPEIRKWFLIEDKHIRKKGKPHTSEIDRPNGSRLIFLSQESDPMAFEGITGYVLVVYDEPIPKRIYTALFRGGRKKGAPARHLIIGTPIGENSTWIREMWGRWAKGEAPDVECFRTSSYVNQQNLAEGFLQSFEQQLSPEEKKVRIEGGFSDLEGLALAHLFSREKHVIAEKDLFWDEQWPCVVAIDCHPSKKNYAVLVGADKDNFLYGLKELSVKEDARPFARTLKAWMAGYRVIDIVCDSLGSTDGSGGDGFKSFIQVLREEGVLVRPTTYNEKSDEDFIDRIRNVLSESLPWFGKQVARLRLVETCRGTMNDIEQVCWQRDKAHQVNKPKLDISNRDFLACLKYALATNPHADKHKAKIYRMKKRPYGLGVNA